jgi:hypothetical protein
MGLRGWVLGRAAMGALAAMLVGPARGQDACVVDQEMVVLPRCALETRGGQLYVGQRFVRRLFSNTRQKMTAAGAEGEGWIYVDRAGRVLVRNVATMDNGADSFHGGLVRVTRDGKWGLATMRGRLAVPMEFDGILDPHEGERRWAACKGCRMAGDGEHDWFEGGTWYWIDLQGRVMSRD